MSSVLVPLPPFDPSTECEICLNAPAAFRCPYCLASYCLDCARSHLLPLDSPEYKSTCVNCKHDLLPHHLLIQLGPLLSEYTRRYILSHTDSILSRFNIYAGVLNASKSLVGAVNDLRVFISNNTINNIIHYLSTSIHNIATIDIHSCQQSAVILTEALNTNSNVKPSTFRDFAQQYYDLAAACHIDRKSLVFSIFENDFSAVVTNRSERDLVTTLSKITISSHRTSTKKKVKLSSFDLPSITIPICISLDFNGDDDLSIRYLNTLDGIDTNRKVNITYDVSNLFTAKLLRVHHDHDALLNIMVTSSLTPQCKHNVSNVDTIRIRDMFTDLVDRYGAFSIIAALSTLHELPKSVVRFDPQPPYTYILGTTKPNVSSQISNTIASIVRNYSNVSNVVCQCSVKGCVGTVDNSFKCTTCWTKHCSICWKVADEGHVCDPADIQSIAVINKVSHCPKCRAPIIRSEGCDHMTCSICGTHYNYATGIQLNRTERGQLLGNNNDGAPDWMFMFDDMFKLFTNIMNIPASVDQIRSLPDNQFISSDPRVRSINRFINRVDSPDFEDMIRTCCEHDVLKTTSQVLSSMYKSTEDGTVRLTEIKQMRTMENVMKKMLKRLALVCLSKNIINIAISIFTSFNQLRSKMIKVLNDRDDMMSVMNDERLWKALVNGDESKAREIVTGINKDMKDAKDMITKTTKLMETIASITTVKEKRRLKSTLTDIERVIEKTNTMMRGDTMGRLIDVVKEADEWLTNTHEMLTLEMRVFNSMMDDFNVKSTRKHKFDMRF